MKILDISWPISAGVTEYKDKGTLKLEQLKEFERDGVRETIMHMSVHTGTHVDAPSHFLADGNTIEHFALEKLVGPARVLDLTQVASGITQQDLEPHNVQAGEIILLKTSNSALAPDAPFTSEFVYLEQSGAQYLAGLGVKSVGIDYLGIERGQPNHETHELLLGKDIPIIEGLRLGDVGPGNYMLYCLPIHLRGVEAAPTRAILIQE